MLKIGPLNIDRSYVISAIKYALTSSIAVLVNWSLLFVFVHFFGIWYLYSEIMANLISTVPFFYGLIKINLVKIRRLSEIFTKPARRIIVDIVGTALNWSILYLLTSRLGVWYLLSEILATLIVFVTWSFNMNILIKVVEIPRK